MVQEPTNAQIAEVLERIADLLEAQEANSFRIRAYREAAQTIRNIDQSVSQLITSGMAYDLRALPHIGKGIAAVIDDYVTSGKSDLLADLEAQVSPGAVFAQVPGIGSTLAQRIVDELHIQTLSELKEAAHDGRLASIEGFGPRRVERVRTALSGMLSRSARSKQRTRTAGT